MKLSQLKVETRVDGTPQLPWRVWPVSWWLDGPTVTAYHGTDRQHLASIAEHGLNRLDPRTGMVSFALEPHTAQAFAVMGGEARFLRGGARAKVVPKDQRCTLVFKLPRAFVTEHLDPELHGNDAEHKARLRDKALYEAWTGSDQQYYQLCELRLGTKVPPKYLIGYMLKD